MGRVVQVELADPVEDMGSWTVRNLPGQVDLAKGSGPRAHRETPVARSGYVHLHKDGNIRLELIDSRGSSGPSNPALARLVLTPDDAREWAAALLALVEKGQADPT